MGFPLKLHTWDDVTQLVHVCQTVSDDFLNETTVRIATHFLAGKSHHASTAAEAESLGSSRRYVRTMRILSASLAHQLETHTWAAVQRAIVERASEPNTDVQLLLYIEFDAYDIVDLTLGVKGKQLPPPASDIANDVGAAVAPVATDEASGVLLPTSGDAKPEIGVQKVLQNEGYSVLVFRAQGRCHIVQGNRASILQVADRGTGETLLQQIQSRAPKTDPNQFARRLRLACADGAGSNGRAERHWRSTHPSWTQFGVHCHVHMLHAIHKRVFHLVDPDVSGMINLALCLRGGRQMANLREALKRTLQANIKFIAGPISAAGTKFKHFVLDTLLGSSLEAARNKTLLLRGCPGDWRNEDSFEYVLRAGETPDIALAMLETVLAPFLCRRAFWIYPRSRWVGADQSLLDIGLWLSIHNVLEWAFVDFLVTNHNFVLPKKYTMAAGAEVHLAFEDGMGKRYRPRSRCIRANRQARRPAKTT